MARETGEYVHGVAWDARLADHGALRGRVAGGRAVERRRHAGSTSPGPALEPRIISEPVIAFFDSPVATLRCRSSPLRALGDARPIPLQAVGRPYAARVKGNAANAGRSAKRQAAPYAFRAARIARAAERADGLRRMRTGCVEKLTARINRLRGSLNRRAFRAALPPNPHTPPFPPPRTTASPPSDIRRRHVPAAARRR